MYKTASDIGDIVLMKLAISPQMAQRALVNAVRRLPGQVKGKMVSPYDMFLQRMRASEKTLGRAAKGMKLPIPRDRKESILKKQLDNILTEATPGGISTEIIP